jgi:hypothetical protein
MNAVPRKYVVKYFDRSRDGDGREHVWAYSAADAVYQFELRHKTFGQLKSARETALGVEPYVEKIHGPWQLYDFEAG